MCTRLTERSEELRSTHPDREQSQGTLDRLCHSRSGSGTLSTLTRVGRAAQCKAKCGVCELKVRAVNAHICRTHSTFRHVLRVRQICSLVRVVSLKKGYICPRAGEFMTRISRACDVSRAPPLSVFGCWVVGVSSQPNVRVKHKLLRASCSPARGTRLPSRGCRASIRDACADPATAPSWSLVFAFGPASAVSCFVTPTPTPTRARTNTRHCTDHILLRRTKKQAKQQHPSTDMPAVTPIPMNTIELIPETACCCAA